MSVWVCMPTKRPPADTAVRFAKWRTMGYKIAVWVDEGDPANVADFDWISGGQYPGYAQVQNHLIRSVFHFDPQCNWVVSAADDIEPDACHEAEEIAAQCSGYFGVAEALAEHYDNPDARIPVAQNSTFGVMQPTGDRWSDNQGAYIDRIAGSPFIGREFARRVYQGNGPYWHEFTHMYCDEHLRAVALKLGVYWERRELIHLHQHWGRPKPGERMGHTHNRPKFLDSVNAQEHWDKYRAVFDRLKAGGFKEAEDLLP